MNITIHRGSNQIGGSCVEIATASTRIIMDVGLPFEEEQQEVLPAVPGLFSPGSKVDAIFLSHAHADHTGLIQKADSDIPVYCTSATSKMMLANSIFARGPRLPQKRQRTLDAGVPVVIGDITVTAFLVPHSVYGSVALLVESDGERIMYSGDLRMHGRSNGMFNTLYAAIKDRPVDTLIMEGTHVGQLPRPGKPLTEWDIEAPITEAIQTAPSLVLASFSPQHLDRLVTFLRATIKAGRVFVADYYTAFIMHLLHAEVKLPRPWRSEQIAVFTTKTQHPPEKIKNMFERDLITLDEILAEPSRYVMVARPSMIRCDFSGKLPQGTRCVYSMWSAYLEKPEWIETQAVLAAASGDLVRHHSGGHITVEDIQKFIHEVNPKELIPIHTEAPEVLREMWRKECAENKKYK